VTEPAALVSVVMIFLNAEDYIAEAIESVRAQSYPHWELLLVDDGSSDGSSAIARDYARQHPDRITCLAHPGRDNRGMSASRNLGIDHARGQWLAFLDSDDVWLPERLERHLAVLQSVPGAAMVYGPTQYWHSWTGATVAQDRILPLYTRTHMPHPPPSLLTIYLRTSGAALPGICSLLVRLDAARAVGGFEADFRSAFEDQIFLSKIALHYPVVVIDEWLDRYRQHDRSFSAMSKTAAPRGPDRSRLRYLEWLQHYIAPLPQADGSVRRLLKRELLAYSRPLLYRLLSLPSRMATSILYLRWRLSVRGRS